MNPELRTALKALGRDLNPTFIQATIALTAPRAIQPDPVDGDVIRDQMYGPHERHRLDVYGARSDGLPRPVLVYVHGGGFVAGDKGQANTPFYRNVGAWAAKSGLLGVTINYRLAPDSVWPAGRDDTLAAVAWLRDQVGQWGGDPNRIWLMGQSAGAVHVADAIAELTRVGEQHRLAGALMLSGLYDLEALDHSPLEHAYFGTDTTRFAQQSSIRGLAVTSLPCLYTVSELDPLRFQRQAACLVEARLTERGEWPRMHFLAGHNHLSPVHTLGSGDDDVGPLLTRFIAETA
ncbi:alpha/beta hydrolase [Cupriavidus sp. 8B]